MVRRIKKKDKKDRKMKEMISMFTRDIVNLIPTIQNLVGDALPILECSTFLKYFDDIEKKITDVIRNNSADFGVKCMKINDILTEYMNNAPSKDDFFVFRTNAIQEDIGNHINRLIDRHLFSNKRGTDKSASSEELEDDAKEFIRKCIPLLYYDHKVEIIIRVGEYQSVFSFTAKYSSPVWKEIPHCSNVVEIVECKQGLKVDNDYVDNITHSGISFKLVKLSDETFEEWKKEKNYSDISIDAVVSFDGTPVSFGITC